MSTAENKAVFLSYASQDAEAATRISESLRAAGVEVWFDQNELVGGDAWDAKIRGQIASCALFVPVISAATQSRLEGYFRIEWKLAARRTHGMATAKAFLLPVVIDGTRDAEAHVPDEFRDVQWTRLPAGEAPEKFSSRVKALLGGAGLEAERSHPGERGEGAASPINPLAPSKMARRIPAPAWIVAAAAIAVVVWFSQRRSDPATPTVEKSAAPAPLSDARRLARQARDILFKTELGLSDFDTAGLLCERASTLDPSDPEVWATASEVDAWRVHIGGDRTPARFDAARSKAAHALSLAPDAFEPRRAQACYQVCVVGGKSAAEAEPVLRALLRERPRDRQALLTLGLSLRFQGKIEETLATFEELAALPGQAARAYNEMGWLLSGAGRRDEANAAIDRSIAAQPFTGNVSLKVFLAQNWLGDLDAARAAVEKLPTSTLLEDRALAAAIRVFHWRREPAEILKLLDAVPRNWITWGIEGPKAAITGDAHAALKQTTAARNDWAVALALVEQRLAASPNDWQLNLWKAYLLAALGQTDSADKTLVLAKESAGTSGLLIAWLSGIPNTYLGYNLLPRLGQAEEALAYLERRAQTGRTTLANLRLNPSLEAVRQLPGYAALLARVQADPRTAPKPGTAASAPTDKSVAVLAFKNLSGDPAREFFSDGLSEAVTDVLGRVPGLKVVGSASAFSFKGKAASIPEIARQLGVTHLVEGTVMQEGQTVRITAKLIQADGFQMWVSDKLDRELKNIFALHDEVAGLIAKNLSLKLVGGREARREVNPEAYQLYLQGRQAWNRRIEEDYVRAEAMFSRAIELEPTFARAYVGRADARLFLAARRGQADTWAQRGAPLLAAIESEVRRALELESDLAEAHTSLGNIHRFRADFEMARQEFLRAIELNPNYATAHQWLGLAYWRSGFLPEARASVLRAVEADPLSSVVAAACSVALQDFGEWNAALVHAERAVSLQPDSPRAIAAKAGALLAVGRRDEAVTLARTIVGRDATTQGLGRALFVLGAAGLADEVEQARHVTGPLANRLRLQGAAALGKWEEFFANWGPAVLTVDDPWFLYMSALDPVRADPRFLAVLQEVGLIEAHARAQAWRKARPPVRK